VNYFYLISCYQTYWLSAHFAALGFLLFTVAWIYRAKFRVTTTILLLSDLTFAVYLFHNWMFDFFKIKAIQLLSSAQGTDFLALVSLFIFCFLLHRIIERPANKLGRVMSLKVTEFKLRK
jgi:peptidoglycan/LPS O-acetylase OafA/YrhL